MSGKGVSTVFVVDDDDQVRQSLQLLLTTVGFRVQGFASAEEFLDSYQEQQSGCLILDLRMPGMGGLSLLEQLSKENTLLPVIILTGHGEVGSAVRALKAKAFDFLEKPCHEQTLIDSVNEALEHNARHREEAREQSVILARLSLLTAREREVMKKLLKCKSNKDIANALGISERTVETHRARIMRKMRAQSLPELIRMILQQSGRH